MAVFVSHAASDKQVADELYDLLQTGCDLRREDIVCSSVEGAGIATGDDFIRWIDEHLARSSLVLLLLSSNYFASKYCLAEMGAAWALKKAVYPIVLPSVGRDPGVVFLGRQSARLDAPGLDDLRDRVANHFPHASKATARWSVKRAAFLEAITAIVDQLPLPAFVARAELERERARSGAAVQLFKEAEDEIRGLRDRIKEALHSYAETPHFVL
jgi:hypothetical protein